MMFKLFVRWLIFFASLSFSLHTFGADFKATIKTQEDVNRAVLAEFQKICETYWNKTAKLRSGEKYDPGELGGIWYGTDYFDALTSNGSQEARIKWLKDRNFFFEGYVSKTSGLLKEGTLRFRLNGELSPAEVIEQFDSNLTIIDCGIAYQLAYYRVLLNFLGTSRFNKFINWQGLQFPELSMFQPDASGTHLVSVIDCEPLEYVKQNIGKNYFFTNHFLYASKHFKGYWAGINVLVSDTQDGDTKYIGFGLNGSGVTKNEIENLLVGGFNKARRTESLMGTNAWSKLMSGLYPHEKELAEVLKEGSINSLKDSEIIKSITNINQITQRHIENLQGIAEKEVNFIPHLSIYCMRNIYRDISAN